MNYIYLKIFNCYNIHVIYLFLGDYMEQSTAYLIMIFLPIIPFFLKLTLSYRIRYKIPKLNADKFYKKKKSSFFRRYFYIELKQRIKPFLFVANLLTGILLIFCVLISLLYLIYANAEVILLHHHLFMVEHLI